MLRKTLLATTIVTFASTAAFAEGGNTTQPLTPKMTAEEIETYSSAGHLGATTAISNGVLMALIIIFMTCAVACGGKGSSSMAGYMMPET